MSDGPLKDIPHHETPASLADSKAASVVSGLRGKLGIKPVLGLVAATLGLAFLTTLCNGQETITYSDVQPNTAGISSPEGKREQTEQDSRFAKAVLSSLFQKQFPLVVESGTSGEQRGSIAGEFPTNTIQTDFATGNDKEAAGFDPNKSTPNFGVSVFSYSNDKVTIKEAIVIPSREVIEGRGRLRSSEGFFDKTTPLNFKEFLAINKDGYSDNENRFQIQLKMGNGYYPYEKYLRTIFKIPRDAELVKPFMPEQLDKVFGLPSAEKKPSREDLRFFSLGFRLSDTTTVNVTTDDYGVVSMRIIYEIPEVYPTKKEDRIKVRTEQSYFQEQDWPKLAQAMKNALGIIVKAPIPPIQSRADQHTVPNRRDQIIRLLDRNPYSQEFGNARLNGVFGWFGVEDEDLPSGWKGPITSIISTDAYGGHINLGTVPVFKNTPNEPNSIVIDLFRNNLDKRIAEDPLSLAMKDAREKLSGKSEEEIVGIKLEGLKATDFAIFLKESFPHVTSSLPEQQYEQLIAKVKAIKENVLSLPESIIWIPNRGTTGYLIGFLEDGTYVDILVQGQQTESRFPDLRILMVAPNDSRYLYHSERMKAKIKELIEQFDADNEKELKQGKPLSPATGDIDNLRGEYGISFPEYRHNIKPQQKQSFPILPSKKRGT